MGSLKLRIVEFVAGKRTIGVAPGDAKETTREVAAGAADLPPDEKEVTALRIATGYPGLHSKNTAVVDLLFDEAKSKYDAGRERSKALDAKAGTLITIVTTGFGAFAILGDPGKLGTGPPVVVGLLALGFAFVMALLAQLPRDVFFPELSLYVSLPTVTNPANAVRVKYELTRSWIRDAAVNDRTSLAKKRLLNMSTTALGVGLAALAVNFAFPISGAKPLPTFQVIVTTPAPSAKPAQPSQSPHK